MKNIYLLLILVLNFTNLQSQNSESDKKLIGPANGSLVIVGGAMQSESIMKHFIELAVGKDTFIVVIPTSSGKKVIMKILVLL